jgi:hypothetical protein
MTVASPSPHEKMLTPLLFRVLAKSLLLFVKLLPNAVSAFKFEASDSVARPDCFLS